MPVDLKLPVAPAKSPVPPVTVRWSVALSVFGPTGVVVSVEVPVSVSPLAPVKVNERSFDPGVTLNGCLVTPRCVQVAWVQSPTKLFVLASKVAAPVPLHWNGCLVRVWVVDVVWLSALVDEDWLRDCVDEEHADAKRAIRCDLRDFPHFPSVISSASGTFEMDYTVHPILEGVGNVPPWNDCGPGGHPCELVGAWISNNPPQTMIEGELFSWAFGVTPLSFSTTPSSPSSPPRTGGTSPPAASVMATPTFTG